MNQYPTYFSNIEKSTTASEKILPVLQKEFNLQGEMINLQHHASNKLGALLDRKAGVDYILSASTNSLYGIAYRIQDYYNHFTFSIRAERSSGYATELGKRWKDIEDEAFYPKWTIQVYVDSLNHPTRILSAGCCRTKDLIYYCVENEKNLTTRFCPEGNKFFAVNFLDVPSCKIVEMISIG